MSLNGKEKCVIDDALAWFDFYEIGKFRESPWTWVFWSIILLLLVHFCLCNLFATLDIKGEQSCNREEK